MRRVVAGFALRVLWVLALLPASGCLISDTSDGRPLPEAGALQVGRSTKADALALLGPPRSIRRQFDGDLLIWRRSVAHLETLRLIPLLPLYETTSGHAESDILALLFDHQGVLAGAGTQRDIAP